MERSEKRLMEAIAPYRRFVIGEEKRLQGIYEGLTKVEERLTALEATIKSDEGGSK
jgi:hypothetical protein